MDNKIGNFSTKNNVATHLLEYERALNDSPNKHNIDNDIPYQGSPHKKMQGTGPVGRFENVDDSFDQ